MTFANGVHTDLLTSGPDIDFGFEPELGRTVPARTCTVSPRWRGNDEFSEPFDLSFRAINTGTRTARDLVFNVHLPLPMASGFQDQPTLIRESDGSATLVRTVMFIHPQSVQTFTIGLPLPRATGQMEFEVTVNAADTSEKCFKLKVQSS